MDSNKSIFNLTTELKENTSKLSDTILLYHKVQRIDILYKEISKEMLEYKTEMFTVSQQVELHSKILYDIVLVVLTSIALAIMGVIIIK